MRLYRIYLFRPETNAKTYQQTTQTPHRHSQEYGDHLGAGEIRTSVSVQARLYCH